MATYQTGSAFRRALEERLRTQSLREGIPLVPLRKLAAFDRFLARLVQVQPNQWTPFCAPGGSRTHSLGVRSASLYPLSYWGILFIIQKPWSIDQGFC